MMSLAIQAIFINQNPTILSLSLPRTHFLKSSNLSFSPLNSKTQFPTYRILTSSDCHSPVKRISASFGKSYGNARIRANGERAASAELDFDGFLSILEFITLASSAVICVYIVVSSGLQKAEILKWVGSKLLAWQFAALFSGVVLGAVIRRRQWGRISGPGFSRGLASPGSNLLRRVEQLEEDLRSSATIIRVLSRQLEKLGIRFRVTRKALKEPIAETAALIQKNSEATRALAEQEDMLEKELGEIQKVLLAMQEQQQKQFELILAIGKTGKFWETKQVTIQDRNSTEASKAKVDGFPNSEINQIEARSLQTEANNDKP